MQDVWAIAQDPENPSLMIAGTRPGGLYRSTDAGATWTVANVPGVRTFSEVNKGPTRVTQILFDPVDRSVIWAGIEIGGIYRSTDGGLNWALREEGLVSADVHGIAVLRDETGAKHLLATTNKGLHRSTDDGTSWSRLPREFGEIRTLHWRPAAEATQQAAHATWSYT